MLQLTLPRQFITNTLGDPIAVILPIEEYELIRPILERFARKEGQMLQEMAAAAQDPLYLADLHETMAAFEAVDAEWWEATS